MCDCHYDDMTEVRFYHLQTKTTAQALPEILGKAFSQGRCAVVKTPDEKSAKDLDKAFWTFKDDSFLPHGVTGDKFEDKQPIWITDKDENPNGADILILTGGVNTEMIEDYALCCQILEPGNDDAIQAARSRWKEYKEKDYQVTYWQQNERGGWDKKAG